MPSLTKERRRLGGTKHSDEVFIGADLRSGRAFQSEWTSCEFQEVKAGLMDMRASRIIDCTFKKGTLYGSLFAGAYLRNVVFESCDMEQASFGDAIFDNVTFRDCRLAYSVFTGGIVRRTLRLQDCNLHGADFDLSEAPDHSLLVSGCNLWGVKASFGCAFWNGEFDQDTVNRFVAMVARVCPDPAKAQTLRSLAGSSYDIVERLMRVREATDE